MTGGRPSDFVESSSGESVQLSPTRQQGRPCWRVGLNGVSPVGRSAMKAHDSKGLHVTRRAALARLAAGALASTELSAAPADDPKKRADGIPGPFPGRVVEVAHPGSVVDSAVQEPVAAAMVKRGMAELVGAKEDVEGWRRL